MSEALVIILATVTALIIVLYITGWKMKKACDFIIQDLEEKKAIDPMSAVVLPYAKSKLINIGSRDYRPRALKELVKYDAIRMLEGGRYYLREGHKLSGRSDKTAQ